jgi:hypothetical protein
MPAGVAVEEAISKVQRYNLRIRVSHDGSPSNPRLEIENLVLL